jgi:hypothetical protein
MDLLIVFFSLIFVPISSKLMRHHYACLPQLSAWQRMAGLGKRASPENQVYASYFLQGVGFSEGAIGKVTCVERNFGLPHSFSSLN